MGVAVARESGSRPQRRNSRLPAFGVSLRFVDNGTRAWFAGPMRTSIGTPLVALVLLTRGAAATPLTEGGQACVNAMNDAGLAVVRGQASVIDACIDPAAPGASSGVPACVANDADPALAVATKATFDAAVAACAELPAFGVALTVDQAVNDAATTHVRGLVDDAFGSSPAGALVADASDAKGRRCQASVVKGMEGIVTRYLERFGRCVEKALGDGAGDAVALADCSASSARGAVAKARKRLVSQTRKRCRGTTTATVLGGRCAGKGTAAGAARCLGARAVCRACRIANAMDELAADCDLVDDGADNDSCTFLVRLSGDAIPFDNGPNGRIEGADISLVEHPERHVTTGPDGRFEFDGLEEGSEATVVLSHPDYHAIQTGTITLGPKGVDRVTFQAVVYDIWDILAALLNVVP
jgi:hypothetical protein